MDREERREEERAERKELVNQEAESLRANGKVRRRNGTKRVNRLWLWLGVLILVFILLWWLYSIGTFEALTGVTNG